MVTAKPHLYPHPEEPALAGVPKDEATARATWFETPRVARLLTMRGEGGGVRQVRKG